MVPVERVHVSLKAPALTTMSANTMAFTIRDSLSTGTKVTTVFTTPGTQEPLLTKHGHFTLRLEDHEPIEATPVFDGGGKKYLQARNWL